jgi:hypothetical protein
LHGYLANLWRYCGQPCKPSYYFDVEETPVMGAKLYEHWLEHLHARKELESMIRTIENLDSVLEPEPELVAV